LETVLITGASSGIGRGIALRLSRTYNLVLGGRDEARLKETRASCLDPERHHLWPFDLANVQGLQSSLTQSIASWGGAVHGFVHSAGMLRVQPFRVSDPATASEVFAVNFFSAAELVRLLTRRALNAEALRNVVFITSGAGLVGEKGNALYSSSKAALHGLTRCLAVELGPSVRVNSLAPGLVRTDLSSTAIHRAEASPAFSRSYPLGIGEPADIAAEVEFLLSAESRVITGQTWVVDGGTLAGYGT
jgi:NAD(P)-dependent dehydrogenase (short-subunit alcohol dehydrogenase family)